MFKQHSIGQSWAIGLSILATFLGCPLASANPNPTATNQQNSNVLESISTSCQNMILAGTEKIKDSWQIRQIRTELVDLTKTYDDHPQGQPLGFSFIIEGKEADTVMGAGKLQHQISHHVINNCNRISLVEFGVYQTDWSLSYGLFEDGEIKRFDCQEPGPGPSLVWGLDFC